MRAKLARLHEPHIAPLTAYVERLRAARGGGESVPWFDPAEGGVTARILILGEAPGPRALGTDGPRPKSKGSGFISPDNNDATAANCWRLLKESGIDRRYVVTWNIVPWYIGDGVRLRAANEADLREAAPATRELLSLLPTLRVAVLYGQKAATGWQRLALSLPAVRVPHPSATNVNTRPGTWEAILAGFWTARERAALTP